MKYWKKLASIVVADNYLGDDKRVFKVPNTVEFMQKLAKEYRKALRLGILLQEVMEKNNY